MVIDFEEDFGNYPKLKKQNANSYYLGLVQNLYAGSEGELACFLQATYQFQVLEDYEQEIVDTLKKIAEQDQKHLSILSHIILMLGGNPKFLNAQNKWFSTREIDYVQGIKQIISFDIELKEKVILDYKSTIQKISSSEIKSVLSRILDDENNHLQVLRNIYANL